jgi:pumilio RNA-binding family
MFSLLPRSPLTLVALQNYVIQFVLEHGAPHDRAEVIQKLKGQMLAMARHKFASNVCEKALVTADPESRRQLVDEIMSLGSDGSGPIVVMMKDQFASTFARCGLRLLVDGNGLLTSARFLDYVLQRAVSTADADQQEMLISRIKPHLMSMRRYNNAYTKHLIAIERLLDKCAKAQLAGQS